MLKEEIRLQKLAVEQAETNLKDSKELYNSYLDDIATYENDYAIFQSDNTKKIQEVINERTYSYKQESDDIGETINHNIQQVQYEVQQYKEARKEDLKNQDEINAEKNKKQIEAGEKRLDALAQQLVAMSSTTEELTPQQIEAWKNLANGSSKIYEKYLKKLPSTMRNKIKKIVEVVEEDTSVKQATEELGKEAEKGFNGVVDGAKWGIDLIKEMSSGMTKPSSKTVITGAASTVASWISQYLHFTVPDKGPLSDMDKSMPDMIDLMVKGIDNNKIRLIKSAEKLAKNLNDSLNLKSNILLNSFGNTKINSQIIDSIRTIFTTPTLNIYAQDELTPAKMNSIIDTVNKRLGSQY